MKRFALSIAIMSLLMIQAFATDCTQYDQNDCISDTTCDYIPSTGKCTTASTTNIAALVVGIILTVFALVIGFYKFYASYKRKREEEMKGIGAA